MSSARISSTADVVVIGGGLIGTSIGWRLRQAGLDVAMVVGELLLTRRACRQYEPLLAPMIRSGLLVEGDRSCDNRLLWRALIEAGHNRSFWMPPASGPPPKRPEPWSWVAMLYFLPRRPPGQRIRSGWPKR